MYHIFTKIHILRKKLNTILQKFLGFYVKTSVECRYLNRDCTLSSDHSKTYLLPSHYQVAKMEKITSCAANPLVSHKKCRFWSHNRSHDTRSIYCEEIENSPGIFVFRKRLANLFPSCSQKCRQWQQTTQYNPTSYYYIVLFTKQLQAIYNVHLQM